MGEGNYRGREFHFDDSNLLQSNGYKTASCLFLSLIFILVLCIETIDGVLFHEDNPYKQELTPNTFHIFFPLTVK